MESKDQDPDGGVRLIQLADIGDGYFQDKSARFLTETKAIDLNCTFLQKGDLLIARMPDPLGRCCIFPLESNDGHVTVVDVCVIRAGKSSVDHKFLMYLINSPEIRTQISSLQSGSTRKRISRKNLATVALPIAPLNEQRRIVARIEELFSELDKGVESLKTARSQLKIYRQAVLKHAFEGKLTAQWREGNNKHDSWSETTLGSLLSYLTSGSRGWADYYSSEGDLFIRAQNLKYDRLELEDVAYVQLPDKSEGMRTRVEIGDLLITITGANVTKTGCVQHNLGKAYVSQHVALCRPIESVSTEFLYWYLIAETFGRKQLNELAYGAGKPGLNLNNIRSVKVSLPCLKEQKQIVLQIRNLLSIEDNLADSIDVELQRVELLRQSILKKAFSGQLPKTPPTSPPLSYSIAFAPPKPPNPKPPKSPGKANPHQPSTPAGRQPPRRSSVG